MNWDLFRKSLVVLAFSLVSTALLASGSWQALGPDGGDARSLAYDSHNPDHLLLGTSTGQLLVSHDAGHNWSRFARLGGDDYVLDHIAIDPQNPKHIYVSAWSVSSQQIGDVFRTRDGGKNWEALSAMHGKSIRAMAMFHANSKVLVAGALDGVFRSKDGGDSWERMSPENHAAIKNIESIAVDPKDPNTVYAGTWHLAWKTADGGASWQQIKKGMIDDSDVFSVIVDHSNPSVVFASACSGIYKSESAGNQFSKIQGIPFSARRTRVLKQAASGTLVAGTNRGMFALDRNATQWRSMNSVVTEQIVKAAKKGSKKASTTTITKKSGELDARVNDLELGSQRWFAATTQGIYSSTDQGKSWKGGPVLGQKDFVSVRAHGSLMVATPRSNALVSNDSGATWKQSGLPSYLVGIRGSAISSDGGIVLAAHEGVYRSGDGGIRWEHVANGLPSKDITSVSFDASHKRLLATSGSTV